MKAVIFGAGGQDGFYLSKLLEKRQVEIIKVSRSFSDGGGFLAGDVADWQFVEKIIGDFKPEYTFHLAANSTTRHAAVFDNHRAIDSGTINILEASYRHSRKTKVFLSGSAVQFKNDGTPIDETAPFAPLSPYAVSRIHSAYAGRYYRSLGLKVYTGYFFNHDSPRRSERHVNQKIAVAARNGEHIEIGDLNVLKEFNFAGDIVEAVWILVNQTQFFEAVIGSGEAHGIKDWARLCFSCAKRDWRKYISVKEDFRAEYQMLVSNPALIKSLGWKPKVGIEQLAKMMVKES